MTHAPEDRPDSCAVTAPETLRRLLLSLVAGDFDTPVEIADAEVAQALERVRQSLRATSPRGSSRDAELMQQLGDGAYLGLLRVDKFEGLTRRAHPEVVEALLSTLLAHIHAVIPGASIGRAAHGSIEFAFKASAADPIETALHRLHARVTSPIRIGGEVFRVQAALGVAEAQDDCAFSDLVARAERALSLAEAGAAPFVIWDEQHRSDAQARAALARDLRHALEAGGLTLAYQPKLNLRTGVIDSVEALVRWRHPILGPVAPDEFVQLAEDYGLIGDLTTYVLTRAIADQASLAERGAPLSMNVNLSGGLVGDEAFCESMIAACRGAVGPIALEITETAVISDPERALRNLHRLVESGVGIAIDDYGSGLSSLAYLKQLPAQELKIDKLFVLGLTSSHRDPLIVRSTIDLAHALEMEVTAEGVDDPIALALLRVMGCDRVQGFHIAKAMDYDDLIVFLQAPAASSVSSGPELLRRIGSA